MENMTQEVLETTQETAAKADWSKIRNIGLGFGAGILVGRFAGPVAKKVKGALARRKQAKATANQDEEIVIPQDLPTI